jgi:DNA topoisomerase-2
MYTIEKPKIKKLKSKNVKPYTKITFKPDYKRFNLEGLTDDIISLMSKRVYDIAACTSNNVKVYLNDKLINVKDFSRYIDIHYNNIVESDSPTNGFNLKKCKIYEEINDRWKVGVIFNPENGYECISYVNGICTYKGGTHVDYIANQLVKELNIAVKKKHKTLKLKPSQIKDNMTIFIDSVIENPSFSSQTKEELTTKKDKYGSECNLSSKFINKLLKTGIVEELVEYGKFKEHSVLKKTDGKKTSKISGIEKLEDANKAGTKQSKKCKLILTEGDSAKALAVAGLSTIGRDYYGVFPLKGKLLNVREANPKQMLNNEEITNLKKILGLKHETVYNDISKLRYGGIVIFTDQDVDGSHIKGLIINFIHYFWPSLAKLDGFITCLTTPVIKVTKNKLVKNFYNLSEYEKWANSSKSVGWSKPKYYKGLGTSTAKEAREYFEDFENKLIKFCWDDSMNKNKNAITLAFEKKRAHDRKKWLTKYDKNQFLDNSQKNISYSDFINMELIHFSKDDNDRSLPCFTDGFKQSQRKIFFVSELKGLHNQKKEIKVAQLAGAVSEKANYHHGEASLCGAIVNLAQDYVGSNNINIMKPNGQFGTRLVGGKDSASVRYIFTRFTKVIKKIFREEDFPILDRVIDDGEIVEPKWYIPIIPMILVNGADGIGTGFSTKIPCYNPLDIVNNLYNYLDNKELVDMKPWYKNFKGHIINVSDNTYEIRGEYKQLNENTLEITELPIRSWTTPYKTFLESITIGSNNDKKKQKKEILEEVENHCTDVSIKFILKFPYGKLQKYIDEGTLENKLKLVKTISINNMHLHNEDGLEIKKYTSVTKIIKDYCNVRIECYKKRKNYLLTKYKLELYLISWKRLFIQKVINEEIIVFKKKKEYIYKKLNKHGFPKLTNDPLLVLKTTVKEEDKNYDYLLNIKISKFTKEELQKLDDNIQNKTNEYNLLKKKSIESIWRKELNEFLEVYNDWFKEQQNEFTKESFKKKVMKKTK